jgi:hypothetical protein
MEGWPVWLASVTLWDREEEIRPTETWTAADRERVDELFDEVILRGIGDPSRQRQFRMCATMCRHRALTSEEARTLPESWFTKAAQDIAGGPVELLWEQGTAPTLSTRPCANPSWGRLSPNNPGLKIPIDCEACPSCLARKSAVGRPIRRP